MPTVWCDIKNLRELGIKGNTRDKWTVDDTLNDTVESKIKTK